MDAATLTALTQSIEKWERNAVAETPDEYTTAVEDCALCALFFRKGFLHWMPGKGQYP